MKIDDITTASEIIYELRLLQQRAQTLHETTTAMIEVHEDVGAADMQDYSILIEIEAGLQFWIAELEMRMRGNL